MRVHTDRRPMSSMPGVPGRGCEHVLDAVVEVRRAAGEGTLLEEVDRARAIEDPGHFRSLEFVHVHAGEAQAFAFESGPLQGGLDAQFGDRILVFKKVRDLSPVHDVSDFLGVRIDLVSDGLSRNGDHRRWARALAGQPEAEFVLAGLDGVTPPIPVGESGGDPSVRMRAPLGLVRARKGAASRVQTEASRSSLDSLRSRPLCSCRGSRPSKRSTPEVRSAAFRATSERSPWQGPCLSPCCEKKNVREVPGPSGQFGKTPMFADEPRKVTGESLVPRLGPGPWRA